LGPLLLLMPSLLLEGVPALARHKQVRLLNAWGIGYGLLRSMCDAVLLQAESLHFAATAGLSADGCTLREHTDLLKPALLHLV
jgi:hypothetical protein